LALLDVPQMAPNSLKIRDPTLEKIFYFTKKTGGNLTNYAYYTVEK